MQTLTPPTPHTASLATSVGAFFDEFDDVFATFDATRVADLFATPYLVGRADGSASSHLVRAATRRHFQGYLDLYRSQGVRRSRHRDLEIAEITPHNVLATVTWELLGAESQVIVSWRETYALTDETGR